MGMPRKGSRTIDVDGQKFRWMLGSSKLSYRWDDPQPARHGGLLTVQEDHERPGHVLQMNLSWLVGSSVTPEIVRELIRRALKKGWKPANSKMSNHALMGMCVDIETIETKLSVIKDVHNV